MAPRSRKQRRTIGIDIHKAYYNHRRLCNQSYCWLPSFVWLWKRGTDGLSHTSPSGQPAFARRLSGPEFDGTGIESENATSCTKRWPLSAEVFRVRDMAVDDDCSRRADRGGVTRRGSAAAVRVAHVGRCVARALRRVLAPARQRVLGWHFGGDRLSTAAGRFIAQRLVSHGRHHDRRRWSAWCWSPASHRIGCCFSAAWPCGARPAPSPPRCCATSHPMPRHCPALRWRS